MSQCARDRGYSPGVRPRYTVLAKTLVMTESFDGLTQEQFQRLRGEDPDDTGKYRDVFNYRDVFYADHEIGLEFVKYDWIYAAAAALVQRYGLKTSLPSKPRPECRGAITENPSADWG